MAGSPTIFSGRRTKLLTADGLLLSDGSINDNNGLINYIKNGHAEVNTTGWSLFADGATLVDGTGGAPTATFARSATTPLRGSASLLYIPGTLGDGVSYNFSIDSSDQAKVLRISFDYQVSATITAGDYQVYIYDVTNSTLIQPAPFKLEGTSGTNYTFSGSFQTSSNSTSYRLIIWQSVSTAVTLKFDNVSVSPQVVSIGGSIGDWQSYTPTGGWTNCTYSGRWRRNGDCMDIEFKALLTGTPVGTLAIGLPNNATIDLNKIQNTSIAARGVGTWFDVGSGAYMPAYMAATSSTGIATYGVRFSSTGNHDILPFSPTGLKTFAAGDYVTGYITVPIVGMGTSQILSSETDTRVCAASFTGSSSSITSSVNVITPTTTLFDTHGAFSVDTYTVPFAGPVEVSAWMQLTAASFTVGQSAFLYARHTTNGVTTDYTLGGNRIEVTASTSPIVSGSFVINCKSGDTIKFAGFSSVTTTVAGSQAFGGSIRRLSGPSQIAASETVSCSYQANASQSITSAAVLTIFGTKMHDTHGAYNSATGTWTTLVSGKFRVAMQVLTITATSAPNNINLRKNTATVVRSNATYLNVANQYAWLLNYTIDLKAGDTLDFFLSASAAGSTYNSGADNFFSIDKVGN